MVARDGDGMRWGGWGIQMTANAYGVPFCKVENVLLLDYGDNCTILYRACINQ